MRNIIVALMLVCSTSVFADGSTNSNTNTNSSAAAAYSNGVNNSGNVAGTDMSSMVPNVSAPGLATTLTETCMGSSSMGAAGAGFGVAFGTTWRDSACVRRLDARQLSAFGDTVTAREVMCDSDLVRAAAKRAGRPCVEDGGQPWGTAVASSPVTEITQTIPTPEAAAPVVNQIVKE